MNGSQHTRSLGADASGAKANEKSEDGERWVVTRDGRLLQSLVWAGVYAAAVTSTFGITTSCSSFMSRPVPAVQAGEAEVARLGSSPATDHTTEASSSISKGHAPSAVGARGLQLPFDGEALRGPLPAPSVANYGAWVQRARVDVGLGYLDSLEPVNQAQWMLVHSNEQPLVFMYDNHSHRSIAKWTLAAASDGKAVLLAWPDRPGREPCFVSGTASGITLYNAVSGQVMKQLTSSPVGDARWSRDSNVLVVANSSIDTQTSELSFYRRSSDLELEIVATLPISERVDAWDLSRDNRFLARGFYPSGTVTIMDLHTGVERLRMSAPGHASSIRFSPDERFLAVGGEGVVVVDLAEPERRAEYSYFYNNVSAVEYSPSGDVLAVASYDGRVRLLGYAPEVNEIDLVHTLRHDGQANIYKLRFIDSGAALVSSSGDQTVRYWGAPGATKSRASEPARSWQSVGERMPPEGAKRSTVDTTPRPPTEQHYSPARLNAAPAPARIAPGKYACKISKLYKLRDCIVERGADGHTLLEFAKGNLLGIRGVVYDDGPVVRFEGWLTEGGSLGCASCQDQPIHGVLKGTGDTWEGVLLYRKHFDPLVPHVPPPADITIDEAIDRYPVMLKRR